MNIAIVCYPTFGGSGVLATELGKALADEGHNIHFITYQQPVRLSGFHTNIFYHEVRVPTYPLFDFPPYETALTSAMVDVVNNHQVDLLHVHYAIPHASKAINATVAMLKAAGADTVYLQPCMVPHWVRGAKEVAYAILPGNKKYPLSVCAIGNTIATKPGAVSAEVVEVKSMEALHELGNTVKGKIVFFNFKMNPLYL